tara:strand:+ start:2414 stop:3409 length:996 start_codon:yes stop_codon:yes gene_type:complete
MQPFYQIYVDGIDKTDALRHHVIALDLHDQVGFQSDTLKLVLDNHGAQLMLPHMGTLLRVHIGYLEQGLVYKGDYIIDEAELSGPPHTMTLHARATNLRESLVGYQTRTWQDTTLGEVINEIAQDCGVEARVSEKLAAIPILSVHQESENHLQFLTRLAQKYNALFKNLPDKIAFLDRNKSETSSGQVLPDFTLTQPEVISYQLSLAERVKIGHVTAFWYDKEKAQKEEVKLGDFNKPGKTLRSLFYTQEEAQAAVEAELARSQRLRSQLSLTCVGLPHYLAHSLLKLEAKTSTQDGFMPPLAGTYQITQVNHQINTQGYQTRIQALKEVL